MRSFMIDEKHCVACGCCAKACPKGAVTIYKGIYAVMDQALCVGCGLCAKSCPASIIKEEKSNE